MDTDRDAPDGNGSGDGKGPEAEPEYVPESDAADRWFDQDEQGEPGPPDGPHTALPPKIEAWRRRSAAGAILTGFALGLQEALEKRKEEPSIVMETSGDPPKDLPVEADFEYGRPRQSVVQIRPWLLPEGQPEGHTGDHAEGHTDAPGPHPDEEER